jgi:hypothetical protein
VLSLKALFHKAAGSLSKLLPPYSQTERVAAMSSRFNLGTILRGRRPNLVRALARGVTALSSAGATLAEVPPSTPFDNLRPIKSLPRQSALTPFRVLCRGSDSSHSTTSALKGNLEHKRGVVGGHGTKLHRPQRHFQPQSCTETTTNPAEEPNI